VTVIDIIVRRENNRPRATPGSQYNNLNLLLFWSFFYIVNYMELNVFRNFKCLRKRFKCNPDLALTFFFVFPVIYYFTGNITLKEF